MNNTDYHTCTSIRYNIVSLYKMNTDLIHHNSCQEMLVQHIVAIKEMSGVTLKHRNKILEGNKVFDDN